MNRFQLALLASTLLGTQAWAQPAPAPTVPPPAAQPPTGDIVVNPAMPKPSFPPAPTLVQEANSPVVNLQEECDSCGSSGACCNLAHPWRRFKLFANDASFDTGNLGDGSACGSPSRFWAELDGLYWRVGGDHLPPLVTTSPNNPLTPVAQAGVLPAATVLVGNQQFNNDPRLGVRLNMGTWINASHTLGFQFGGFMLADRTESTDLASNGNPILARPFTNVQPTPPVQASQIVAYPNVADGAIGVRERSTLQGLDFAIRGNVCCGDIWRIDALVGYRYLRFTEQLSIQERLVAGVNAPATLGIPTGTIVTESDRFDTGNVYHAAQVGFTGELRLWERVSLIGTTKASFGIVNQGVGIDGHTRFSTDNVDRLGGLLALNSNIGAYHRSDSALVPELNLNLSYQVTNNIRLRLGYDLIYIPNVQRAASVIDLSIDPRRIPPITSPTVNRPSFDNAATDLFIQGVSAGLEFRY